MTTTTATATATATATTTRALVARSCPATTDSADRSAQLRLVGSSLLVTTLALAALAAWCWLWL